MSGEVSGKKGANEWQAAGRLLVPRPRLAATAKKKQASSSFFFKNIKYQNLIYDRHM